jgi:hypothetical protein
MSGLVAGFVWRYYLHGGNERMLAARLADNADEKGRNIFPSVATLAAETILSERTVQRLLSKMRRDGWLIVVRKAHGGGRGGGDGRATEYRINPEWIRASEMGVKLSPISGGKRVTTEAEMGDTAVSEMGDTVVSPYPSRTVIEPNTPQPPKGGDAANDSRGDEGEPDGFKVLVAAYPPHRVNLSAALRQWRRLNPNPAMQAAMAAAAASQAKTAEWARDEGRPVPNLSKWIRNRAWRAYAPKLPTATSAPQPPVDTRSAEQREADRQRAIEARAKLASMVRRREAVPA